LDKHEEEFNMQVISCVRYKEAVKQTMNLSSLVGLFTLIDYKKKQEYKALQCKKNEVYQNLAQFDQIRTQFKEFPQNTDRKWQMNESMQKDLEEFLNAQKLESTEQAGEDLDTFKYFITQFLIDATLIGAPIALVFAMTRTMEIMSFVNIPLKTRLRKVFKTWICPIALTVAASVYCVYKYNSMEESGTTKTSKPAAARVVVPSNERSGNLDNIMPHIQNATGTLSRAEDGVTVNCLFIKGTYLLTVNHFFQDYTTSDKLIPQGSNIYIRKRGWGLTRKIQFDKNRIIQFKTTKEMDESGVRHDIILYKLNDREFNNEKDITKFFWDGSYGTLNHHVAMVDLEVNTISKEILKNEDIVIKQGKVTNDKQQTIRRKGNDIYYHYCAAATYMDRSSACGSAVVELDGSIQRPILGVHIALSRDGSSLFHYVTCNQLNDAITESTIDIESAGVIYVEGTPSYLPESFSLEFLGQI
jgi:hypothetical protein